MATPEPEVWVVVSSHDGARDLADRELWGPIVLETYTKVATREEAMKRAAQLEPRHGPCRIARLVFEDEPQQGTNS